MKVVERPDRFRLYQAHRGALFHRRNYDRSHPEGGQSAVGRHRHRILCQVASQILQDLLQIPHHRALVHAFSSLAAMDDELTFLEQLKTEADQDRPENNTKRSSVPPNSDVAQQKASEH
jgi:hypothetical protein